jgi:hypothetical protein
VTGSQMPQFDLSRPHPARVYDYYLGGKNHFAADRELAEKAIASMPSVRTAARENRSFLGRSVRFLSRDAGIRQFLDIGTGLPTVSSVHEIAQAVAPSSRVAYVDNDPLVLAHARALLISSPEGRTAYIQADSRDPESILASPSLREVLDFSQPIALLLVAILHFIPDEAKPARIVSALMDSLPSGSYLVATHGTLEYTSSQDRARIEEVYASFGIPGRVRDSAEFGRMAFAGLRLLPPGVVPVTEWRPETADARPTPAEANVCAGVAYKP